MRWLNEKRIVAYSRMIAVLNIAAFFGAMAWSDHFIDPFGKPIGNDFIGFWAAGKIANAGPAADAYDNERHMAEERKALPWRAGQQPPFLPWFYPPTFLAVAAVLSLLPYGVALCLWLAATLPIYLVAIRAILPGAVIVALAFPAVFSNFAHGQTGFLTAGLLGGALALLESRPWTAGILFGLFAYKPQFGILVPLALIAGGYWRTICAASLTIAATVGASWALWGGDPWRAFFSTLRATGGSGLEHGSEGLEKLQSVFAAVRLLGGGTGIAWTLQIIFAIAAAATVVWVWRKPGRSPLRSSALATAALLATPYVFDYDLIILALPIAWVVGEGLRDGLLPSENAILFALWWLPLFSRTLAKYAHLPLAPVLIPLLLLVIIRRCARPLEPLPPSGVNGF